MATRRHKRERRNTRKSRGVFSATTNGAGAVLTGGKKTVNKGVNAVKKLMNRIGKSANSIGRQVFTRKNRRTRKY